MTARMSSYAYLQRKVDDEAWIPLKLYPGSVALAWLYFSPPSPHTSQTD